jgi:hypothetical protein
MPSQPQQAQLRRFSQQGRKITPARASRQRFGFNMGAIGDTLPQLRC